MSYSEDEVSSPEKGPTNKKEVETNCDGRYFLGDRRQNRSLFALSWIDTDEEDGDYIPSRHREADHGRQSEDAGVFHAQTQPLMQVQTPESQETNDEGTTESSSSQQISGSSDEVRASSLESNWKPATERDPNEAYHLRPRKYTTPSPSSHQEKGNTVERDDEATEPCLNCQAFDLVCSLVYEPEQYPCEACRVDELDCKQSSSPKWKRPCEYCRKHKDIVCSYVSAEYDHRQSCFECQQHGFRCIAGPARHTPTGNRSSECSDVDMNDEHSDEEYHSSLHLHSSSTVSSSQFERPASTAMSVLEDGTASSPLQADGTWMQHMPVKDFEMGTSGESTQMDDTGVPEDAELENIPDENVHLTRTSSVEENVREGGTQVVSYQPEQNPTSLPATILPSFDFLPPNLHGALRRIRTFYPHPLIIVDETQRHLCDWCNNHAYGIVGLGERYPQVLDSQTGQLAEIADGHISEGRAPSHMCRVCVVTRGRIMQCSHAETRSLNVACNVFDAHQELNRAYAALHDPYDPGFGRPVPPPLHVWCSLCQSPATRCCDVLQFPMLLDSQSRSSQPPQRGCGLMLCEHCANLVYMSQGNLDLAVYWGQWDRQHGAPLRADIDYILRDISRNLLRQNLRRYGF
ncbi:hypothetical protein N7539_004627 [Penicillium diatomitis]|uniref:Zn(2)-C6 fungal-type domain-containing protein n=1 Tax=Penicillium diatomitis TaxID=2819901 RepID=A0A9W9XED3_9EURO|nr:uncharacterized protein N7539_004627 [Penicillium diatomitis]KAJ5489737.1 hypothetical protein N7539_004627 [Penicillium diatomitis]